MLVSGHKLRDENGQTVNIITVVDPQTGSALTLTDNQAVALAEQIQSVAMRTRLEVGN